MLEARQEGPSVSSIVVVCCRRRTPMYMQEPFVLWVVIVKVFFVSLKSKDLVAAHVTVVAAVLVCVSAAVSTNSGGDDNLNNGNLVHDTVLGVGRGGHNLIVLQGVGDVGNGGDDGRSVIGHGGRGGLGDHGGRALDVVDRDTAATEGVGRSVGLSRDRGGSRGGDGLDGLLVVLVASLEGRGVLGSVLNLDVTAEAVRRTSAVVDVENLGHVLDLARGLLGLGLEASGEDRAVLNATREVGAGLDSLLEGIDVPAVDEISVVSVGSGVTVGECELTRHALELVGVPDGLVEERRVALVVTFRALATVDHVGVSHVALVVRSGRIAVTA